MSKSCSIDGCQAKHYGKGMCKPHYMALWNRGAQAKAYEQQRRTGDARRQHERARNRRRRSYINAWLRQRRMDIVIVETVDSDQVFRRDGYRCRICGKKANGKWPSPSTPTVDHIVPLSKGGEHSYRNVQCACWACNKAKGNGAANDQLRLIG